MHSNEVNWLKNVVTRVITKGHQQITTLQSLPTLSQVLILILGIIMIPFILGLTFPILLALVFAIPGIIMCFRWLAMFSTDDDDIGVGDMRVPTFYASYAVQMSETTGDAITCFICMPIVGLVFGGIHCVGWFFDFPSSAEAMLWRVSSAVLSGIAFLFPLFVTSVYFLLSGSSSSRLRLQLYFAYAVFSIILLVYVVSRLLLLVEAFISLRHLTPGMLALVKWTSFIPHI